VQRQCLQLGERAGRAPARAGQPASPLQSELARLNAEKAALLELKRDKEARARRGCERAGVNTPRRAG
jgi:hypothetical protein